MSADGPVFADPWEARTFALAVTLQDRGVFTAQEWAATVGAEGDWLSALERLVAEKQLLR
jgi:hypothetical protein